MASIGCWGPACLPNILLGFCTHRVLQALALALPQTLLQIAVAALSAIGGLLSHLVSSSTVRAWGSRPTSRTRISSWWPIFRTSTASSWEMVTKLQPFTSRIWSPTWCKKGGGGVYNMLRYV